MMICAVSVSEEVYRRILKLILVAGQRAPSPDPWPPSWDCSASANGWQRARRGRGSTEQIEEIIALAEPGKPFQDYSRTFLQTSEMRIRPTARESGTPGLRAFRSRLPQFER